MDCEALAQGEVLDSVDPCQRGWWMGRKWNGGKLGELVGKENESI